jgi:hypothetical protein
VLGNCWFGIEYSWRSTIDDGVAIGSFECPLTIFGVRMLAGCSGTKKYLLPIDMMFIGFYID